MASGCQERIQGQWPCLGWNSGDAANASALCSLCEFLLFFAGYWILASYFLFLQIETKTRKFHVGCRYTVLEGEKRQYHSQITFFLGIKTYLLVLVNLTQKGILIELNVKMFDRKILVTSFNQYSYSTPQYRIVKLLMAKKTR